MIFRKLLFLGLIGLLPVFGYGQYLLDSDSLNRLVTKLPKLSGIEEVRALTLWAYNSNNVYPEKSDSIVQLVYATAEKSGLQSAEVYAKYADAYRLRLMGEYSQAQKLLLSCTDYLESENDDNWLTITVYNELANIYAVSGFYQSAEKWYTKAKVIAQTGRYAERLNMILFNLGNLYQFTRRWDQSIQYYNEASQLALEEKDSIKFYLCITSRVTSELESEGHDLNASKKLLEEGIVYFKKLNNINYQGMVQGELGRLYLQEGNLQIADSLLRQSLQAIEKYGIEIDIIRVLEPLMIVSRQLGDSTAALEYYDHLYASQSKYIDEELGQMTYLISGYEKELISKEIEQEQLQRKTYLGLAFLFLASTIAILAVRLYRNEKRLNKELTIQNQTITIQAADLESLNQKLKEADSIKSKIIRTITHDFKTPINQLGSIVYLLQKTTSLDKESSDNLLNLVKDKLENNNGVLNNLISWTQSLLENVGDRLSKEYAISAVFDAAVKSNQDIINNKGIEVISQDGGCTVHGDQQAITIVVRNLLANACKFSDNQSSITLKCEPQESCVEISVIDKGMGMSEHQIAALMRKKEVESTKGTLGETGTGLGIIICQDVLARYGSDLKIESQKGQGTRMSFILSL